VLTEAPAVPLAPAEGAFAFCGNGPGLVIHRAGEFQAQLFICEPNSAIPEHTHPNVDSFEAHVGGDLHFYVEGAPSIPEDHLHDRRNGASRWWGRAVRVRQGVKHHLKVGPAGGAFVSVQRWLNGVAPTSVDDDWDGSPMDARHLERLTTAQAAQDPDAPIYVAGQICD
jgi:hypothetical protein